MKPLVKPELTIAEGAVVEAGPWDHLARHPKIHLNALYGKLRSGSFDKESEELARMVNENADGVPLDGYFSNMVSDPPLSEEDLIGAIDEIRKIGGRNLP